jgi:hypothetical protein
LNTKRNQARRKWRQAFDGLKPNSARKKYGLIICIIWNKNAWLGKLDKSHSFFFRRHQKINVINPHFDNNTKR